MASNRKKQNQHPITMLFTSALFIVLIIMFRPWEFIGTDESSQSLDNGSGTVFTGKEYGDLEPDIEAILSEALSLENTPFLTDGTNPDEGFNSSGFVQYVYQESTGIRLPRIAGHQFDLGESISLDELYPGDMVFFQANTLMSGIYLGHGEFMTVSETNGVETLSLEGSNFWADNYIGAKRLTEEEAESLHPSTYEDHEHPAVEHAMQYLDTPYVFGGNTLDGFDCSFLIQQVFRESSDVYLPRVTVDQHKLGKEIDLENIQPGDVLFFSAIDLEEENRGNGEVTHAGIYVGNDFMIHASRTEAMTQISYINEYWSDAFTSVQRYDELSLHDEEPVVQEAARHLTTPFKSGGSSPEEGFNTSGFVSYVYQESLGIQLPNTANDQWNSGTEIERDELQPGDVLFFDGSGSYLSAIYIGHDQFMIASESSGVTTRHLEHSEFFSDIYAGARRYE
ncbi:C40 family peptidase [Salipaludibacillus sp. CF4.18]|uniref:C40 family peptidase n=1 Tax=Salipaludibacillus sp. CF4.18 TaxID=3373081 RepID=UPI003EE75852